MIRAAFISVSIALLTLIVPEVWKDMFESLRQSLYWRFVQVLCIVWIVVVALLAMPWSPIMEWGMVNRLKSVLLFALVGALLFGGGFYLIVLIHDRLPRSQTAVAPEPLSKSDFDAAIADIGRQIGDVRDLNLNDPSKDSESKLSFLKKENDRLAEKPELTTQQKEALDDNAITLDSLEAARKETAARRDIEKQLQENKRRQAEIEQESAAKKANKVRDLQEKELAERFVPIYQYAVTRLYEMLEGVAKESSEKIHSDFPGKRPSIERSNLVREGKLAAGKHVIGLGSRQEWEFHLTISGTRQEMESMFKEGWMPYWIIFKIQAGGSYVAISAPRPMTRQPFLQTALFMDRDQRSSTDSTFSEYQKPIDQALKKLIQHRYYEAPLKNPNLKQP